MRILSDYIMLGFLIFCANRDRRYRSVPVWLLLAYSLVSIVLAAFVKQQTVSQIVFGAILGLLFFVISALTKEAIGYGDSWVITILGCYLGFETALWMLLVSSLVSSAVSSIQLWRKRWDKKYTMPFIPFMVLGFLGVIIG